jgi:hypothetical protein
VHRITLSFIVLAACHSNPSPAPVTAPPPTEAMPAPDAPFVEDTEQDPEAPAETGALGHGAGPGTGGGMSIGQVQAVGDLDKAIIRRYIKRNAQRLNSCYESQLRNNSGLEGTVNTQFFIDPTGKVTTSSASGVNAEVSSCIAGVIRSIEFPKPKGGGGVQVNYPFKFSPTSR